MKSGLLFFTIFLSASISVLALTARTLEKEEVIQGTTFKKGTVVEQDEKKYLYKAVLAVDQAIVDKVLGKSFPHIFPAGSELIFREPIDMMGEPQMIPHLPEKIIIHRRMKIYDVMIAPGTEVLVFGGYTKVFNEKSYYAEITLILIEDIIIKGKKIASGSYIKIETKTKIQVSKAGGWVDL